MDTISYKGQLTKKEVQSAPDVRAPGEHMMSNLVGNDREFLKKREFYIESLAKKLNIPLFKLDYSFKSQNLIDSIYTGKRPAKIIFFREDYLYLIAYLGEMYRKVRGGEWYFEREPRVISYIPYIKLPNGKKMDVYDGLFKECYENYEHMSIFGVADFELLKNI